MLKTKSPSKRILSVTIKRMVDTNPDTSYLGEYSQNPTSEFSIDRAHAQDCASVKANHRETVDKLERIRQYLEDLYNLNLGTFNGALGDSPAHQEAEHLQEALDTIVALQDEATECDCSGGDMGRHEFRYFNPSFNYVTKEGKPDDNLTPDDVRKYTRQDYERMEQLNAGSWCYIGIRAEAEVCIVRDIQSNLHRELNSLGPIQHITSGGLYGIESDSDRKHIESIEKEELAELRSELLSLGFSKRAVSMAFRNVEHSED